MSTIEHATPFPNADVFQAAAARARIGWRRFSDVAVETPGSMYVHVVRGKVVGWGIEPIGDVIVSLDGTVTRALDGARGTLDRARVAAAAVVGTLAGLGLGAGAGVMAHRRFRR